MEDTLTPCLNQCTTTWTECKKARRLFGFGSFEKQAKCDTENAECHGKCHMDNSAKLKSMMDEAQKNAGGMFSQAKDAVEGKEKCMEKCMSESDKTSCAEKCAE